MFCIRILTFIFCYSFIFHQIKDFSNRKPSHPSLERALRLLNNTKYNYLFITFNNMRNKAESFIYRCGKEPQNPQDFKKCDLLLLSTWKDRPRDAPASKKMENVTL